MEGLPGGGSELIISNYRSCCNLLMAVKRDEFDVFSTVNHSIELFHQPTLMHKFIR